MQADKFVIVGTCALREAKNSSIFCQEIKKQTGQKVNVLSSEKEAQLSFEAIKHSIKTKSKYFTIIDIGGGSTEIIQCKDKKILSIKSLPLGAVYLTEKYKNNISEMGKYIFRQLAKIKIKSKIKSEIIGTGGTITTLGALKLNLKKYNPKKIHNKNLYEKDILKAISKFHKLPLAKRRKLIHFSPKRGDIILAGLVILKSILQHFKTQKFTICDRGLVYGLAYEAQSFTQNIIYSERADTRSAPTQ